MNRRRFVTVTATTATASLAGCAFGDFGDGEELNAELEDDDGESFEADEGDEFEVTVTVEGEDDVDVRISYDLEATVENAEDEEEGGAKAFSGPVLDETVDDEETFDIEIPTDGYYEVTVTGGSAQVTVE